MKKKKKILTQKDIHELVAILKRENRKMLDENDTRKRKARCPGRRSEAGGEVKLAATS